NHVAVELDMLALQQQHDGEFGGDERFIVAGSASPYETVFAQRRKRIYGPFFALYADNIGMAQHHNRFLRSIAANARHQVRAIRIDSELLRSDTLAIQDQLQVLGDARFVAGRIAGIDSDEAGKVVQNLRLQRFPINVGWIRAIRREKTDRAAEPSKTARKRHESIHSGVP